MWFRIIRNQHSFPAKLKHTIAFCLSSHCERLHCNKPSETMPYANQRYANNNNLASYWEVSRCSINKETDTRSRLKALPPKGYRIDPFSACIHIIGDQSDRWNTIRRRVPYTTETSQNVVANAAPTRNAYWPTVKCDRSKDQAVYKSYCVTWSLEQDRCAAYLEDGGHVTELSMNHIGSVHVRNMESWRVQIEHHGRVAARNVIVRLIHDLGW